MPDIDIGMTRAGLLKLAEKIKNECDAYPDSEGIEIKFEAESRCFPL